MSNISIKAVGLILLLASIFFLGGNIQIIGAIIGVILVLVG